MSDMFNGAEKFDKDISDWDVSNVIDMNYMFYGAREFNTYIGIGYYQCNKYEWYV